MANPGTFPLQFEPYLTNVDVSFWQRLTELKLDVYKLSDAAVSVHGAYQAGRQFSTTTQTTAPASSETSPPGERSSLRALPSTIRLSADAFDSPTTSAPLSGNPGLTVSLMGQLYNANTIEDFVAMNRAARLQQAGNRLWLDITQGQCWTRPQLLNPFVMLSFADLKKYRYYYRCAFPAIPSRAPPTLVGSVVPLARAWADPADAKNDGEAGTRRVQALRLAYATYVRQAYESEGSAALVSPYFVIIRNKVVAGVEDPASAEHEVSIHPLADYPELSQACAASSGRELTVGFIDPCGLAANPGWPLRNLLLLLQYHHSRVAVGTEATTIRVVSLRDSTIWGQNRGAPATATAGGQDAPTPDAGALHLTVLLPSVSEMAAYQPPVASPSPDVAASTPGSGLSLPAAAFDWPAFLGKPVGWERHPEGKTGPRAIDLAAAMDPTHLATTAMELNLKLMKWRVAPDLNLAVVQRQRCLLLGAGTLGTYVARALLPLYQFSDCLNGGKWKAKSAAEQLKGVYPHAVTQGHVLTIPMPGHAVGDDQRTAVEKDLATLEALVRSHDVLFLLTDSREARWLPTLWGAYHGKTVINAALGFDGYLVMRHGYAPCGTHAVRDPSSSPGPDAGSADLSPQLGCYFCNDVVAPTDSLSDRTLDQQCTVTRPGLAPLASALAVELLVTILQHPLGVRAPAPAAAAASNQTAPTSGAWMGDPPHQIRGFLTGFQQQQVVGQAYDKCTACSDTVLGAYHTDKYEFLWKVFNNYRTDGDAGDIIEYSYLEALTGLRELKLQTEGLLADLDWGEGDDELDNISFEDNIG
ncbi:Autophagy protein 7 [Tieghemiomyces parasiticus]|uniref:Autophagy protein 7 n=1 Tax=Tieghemiomyces parasiticus TaxID=78921 RepID=A0A9W8A9H0_9FUNG|nr:Autophagy protein 7 [Tieghemiomyces parasiticus]